MRCLESILVLLLTIISCNKWGGGKSGKKMVEIWPKLHEYEIIGTILHIMEIYFFQNRKLEGDHNKLKSTVKIQFPEITGQ